MARPVFLRSVMLLQACSNQQIYENIQRDQRQRCQTLPQSEFERCMARAGQSFEDYWRDREEAINREPSDR